MQSLVLCELAKTPVAGLESYSPFCLKTHRALRLARLPYVSRHMTRPSEIAHLNPQQQVPVLLIEQRKVLDSTNILTEIVKLAPDAFALESERARAEAWLWEDYADTALNGFLVAARWADDRNWGLVREAYFEGAPWLVKKLVAPMVRRKVVNGLIARDFWRAGAEACWARFENVLDNLETRAPEKGFWMGSISVADISIFAQLHSMRTDLTAPQREMLARRARLWAYLDRVDGATKGSSKIRLLTSVAA